MSDDVKRYMICGGGAHEAPGGTWVRADDYDRLRAKLQRIQSLVDEQAEDEGLWSFVATAHEKYLQQALRRLHAVIEERGDMSDVCKHGSLARSCEICERDKVIDRLRAEVERLQTIVDHYHQAQSALVRKERGDE